MLKRWRQIFSAIASIGITLVLCIKYRIEICSVKTVDQSKCRNIHFKYIIIFSGLYPQPYLLIRSKSKIEAVDMLTQDKIPIMTGLKNSFGLAIDIKDKKVYFGDGNGSISEVNFDGSGRKVILKNANVYKMAVDWIGRRIFWTKSPLERKIFVVNMDGKNKRTLTTTQGFTYGIAVDPLAG